MKLLRALYWPFALLLITSLLGCSSMKIADFAGKTPEFRLEEYFVGKTRAWGMVHDRFGNLVRQFVVDIDGVIENDTLILTEDFVYDDGETQQRIWKIRKRDGNKYEGRADDVIGVATGEVQGNALNWKYYLNLKYGDGHMVVHFDDWMYLQNNGVLLNRAVMTKWGIELAEVVLAFQRLPEVNTSAPANTSSDPAISDVSVEALSGQQ